jgi:hypothetical protein
MPMRTARNAKINSLQFSAHNTGVVFKQAVRNNMGLGEWYQNPGLAARASGVITRFRTPLPPSGYRINAGWETKHPLDARIVCALGRLLVFVADGVIIRQIWWEKGLSSTKTRTEDRQNCHQEVMNNGCTYGAIHDPL